MGRVLILLLLISGCATVEVVDGLCYTNKEGTYICLAEKEVIPTPEKEIMSTPEAAEAVRG